MKIRFYSDHETADFSSGRLTVALRKDDESGKQTCDEIWFSVPPDFHTSNDCVAAALLTLCGTRYSTVEFNFPISAHCARLLAESHELESIGPIDPGRPARAPGKHIGLSFSGGFDSLALWLLLKRICPGDVKLISTVFGGSYEREARMFASFAPDVLCETNLRQKKYDKNGGRFIGATPILYADYLDLGAVTFGHTLDHLPVSMESLRDGGDPSFLTRDAMFRASGLEELHLIRSLSQFGTSRILMRFAPELIEDSLASLASKGTEKYFRKQLILTHLYEASGVAVPDAFGTFSFPKKPRQLGDRFTSDFRAIFFAKRFGIDTANRMVSDLDRYNLQPLLDLDLHFFDRYSTNAVYAIPERLRPRLLSCFHECGIYPFTERDWYEFDKVREFLLAARIMPEVYRRPGSLNGTSAGVYEWTMARAVEAMIPPGSEVAVVSRGDEDLVHFPSRRGWHFPRTLDGLYAGYHPANSAEAIEQLESIRAQGAGYLVFPSESFWWLGFYQEFTAHLDLHYERLPGPPCCVIYDLCATSGSRHAGAR